jgi:hypothetical protein
MLRRSSDTPLCAAACAGFVAGASAEILGAGPLLGQLSKFPQPVLAVMLLITAGSIIPVVKGSEGGYLQSLRETYTIPEGVFTEPLVRQRCYTLLCCCCFCWKGGQDGCAHTCGYQCMLLHEFAGTLVLAPAVALQLSAAAG